MWNTAEMARFLSDARDYGFDVPKDVPFNFAALKEKRDAYVKRLNGIYTRNLNKDR